MRFHSAVFSGAGSGAVPEGLGDVSRFNRTGLVQVSHCPRNLDYAVIASCRKMEGCGSGFEQRPGLGGDSPARVDRTTGCVSVARHAAHAGVSLYLNPPRRMNSTSYRARAFAWGSRAEITKRDSSNAHVHIDAV